MTSTLEQLAQRVLQRLEEDPDSPVFWSKAGEVYPALNEAMCEAVLISGEPEVRAGTALQLDEDQPFYQNPPEAVAVIRLETPDGGVIRRVTIAELDKMDPNWQQTRGTKVKYWFPFGMTRFGVYPRLSVPVQVVPTYIALPITDPRPWDGTQSSLFQQEFEQGLTAGAASVLRVKEAGLEFQEGLADYDFFLKTMQGLSRFGLHKAALRFTRRGGIPAKVAEARTE